MTHAPHSPVNRRVKHLKGGVGNLLYPQLNLPQIREGPFRRSVASLPRFGPLLKKVLAMPVIILFMFALYISRYYSVRNTHFPWICIFFLLFFYWQFPQENPPKVCTRSFNFNLKNAKAPSSGRGDTPLPDPPPARALRALACVFPTILQILPPHEKIPAYGLRAHCLEFTINSNFAININ